MTREAWISVRDVTKIEYGTRPATVIMVFANPVARDNFVAEACNGHQIVGGAIRHDTEKSCLVHGTDHDGFSPERLALYADDA